MMAELILAGVSAEKEVEVLVARPE